LFAQISNSPSAVSDYDRKSIPNVKTGKSALHYFVAQNTHFSMAHATYICYLTVEVEERKGLCGVRDI
jgi:hypothetical protein